MCPPFSSLELCLMIAEVRTLKALLHSHPFSEPHECYSLGLLMCLPRSEFRRYVLWVERWCKYLEHVGSNDHHGVVMDDNGFRSRGRLPCGKDSHLRRRLLEYKCEMKSQIGYECED